MEASPILEKINGMVWGNGLVFLLIMTGIIYTVKLRGIQFTLLIKLLRKHRKKDDQLKNSGLSQLKTVCMSLGTAMGTGNITGVASAIAVGGAGAIFWMWVSAFFGMALVYAENYLGIKYSTDKCKGSIAYIRYGLGSPFLAGAFALFCILASLGMGGMVQVNSFTESLNETFCVKNTFVAVCAFTVIFAVIKGGAKSIGQTAQFLLPFATLAYTAASAAVIIAFSDNIIPVFSDIFSDAFGVKPICGGIGGFAVSRAVSTGIRRGIFSNEAGLGSSPILHAAASDTDPELQGLWSMAEVFIDTFLCCTITALVILTSGKESAGAALSVISDRYAMPFLTVILGIFAFCTIIGWYYCGESAFVNLFGAKKTYVFTFIFAVVSSLGALISAPDIWLISDIFNGAMAFPNLLALLLLIKRVKKE